MQALQDVQRYRRKRWSPFSVESFETKKKGIVFLALTEGTSSFFFGKKENSLPFHVRKFGDPEGLPYEISAGFNSWVGGHSEVNYISGNMLYLDPGLYYIDYVNLMSESSGYYIYHRWYPSPGITKDHYIRYGAFFVEAGKVVSLGRFTLPKFHRKDDLDALKEQLRKSKYAFLADLVTKGTFYARGSLVTEDKKGHIKVVDAKIVKDAYHAGQKQAMQVMDKLLKDHKKH